MKLSDRLFLSLFSVVSCFVLDASGFESVSLFLRHSRTNRPFVAVKSVSSSRNSSKDGAEGDAMGSLAALCQISKRACDALTPMIVAFYDSINAETSKLKDDKSAFTIADGTVQHLLVDYLFGSNKFRGIVGEEDCAVNLCDNAPFTVDDLTIPEAFVPIVNKARLDIRSLADEIIDCDLYRSLTIFIDPIDGTREFSTGKGEQCSVCIGFADAKGNPVAGVVYRPITDPPTWAAGAKSEGYFCFELDEWATQSTASNACLLTSNGSVSPFLVAFMKEMGYERVPSGGAGNKMLMLLENKGSAYIQDRGVSRWDTCAAQACIEAQGGVLCKLTSFMQGKPEGYTYLQSENNLDFEEGISNLTMYNCRSSVGMQNGDPTRSATNVMEVKPYSNLCGLFALGRKANTDSNKQAILAAVEAASKVSAPAFD
jgi:3'(2'), 5'-bisphosphate nucleotidase